MPDWLVYWRPDTERTGVMYHAASNQFHKVEPGDEVWFVTIDERELLLFGHMMVGERISDAEAKARFGDVWEAEYHIVPKGKAERCIDIPITNLAQELRFEGRVDRLPLGYSGCNLQTIRKLTLHGTAILRRAWNANGKTGPSQIAK
jgi:hypothetical protein